MHVIRNERHKWTKTKKKCSRFCVKKNWKQKTQPPKNYSVKCTNNKFDNKF